ncbi:MAG: CDP-diacylglycerol--glycerol-3-phosphate 3-phosphatidyltransferase [Phycisphaeraceae bacterium]|nr:CDP-diacylglycerol--glycerol-3-phosphate 3-phosphatidyltransferase [Phycisphaeraceae bacterium]QYK48235.1 MAG: CDP-diacylglycerol--glycerol-3-phosphate 3-phosphatidyltransferase [Phycisphaeraceae bacterium]
MPEPAPNAAHPATRPAPAPWQVHLPNALTLLRVAMTALFVGLIAFRSRPFPTGASIAGDTPDIGLLLAAALFVLAALTDALDGYLARKWRVVSKFGRVMDPFADKVLVLGAFIMLAGPAFTSASGDLVSGVAPWMVVVILARELLVTSIRAALEGDGIDFSAGWAGKAKMVLQSVVVPLILMLLAWGAPARGSAGAWTIDIAVWATVVATILSGIPYITRAISATRKPAT